MAVPHLPLEQTLRELRESLASGGRSVVVGHHREQGAADLPEDTRIAATFQAKGRGRSLVGVEHTRVKSAERAAEWKGDRRTWPGHLKKLLERGARGPSPLRGRSSGTGPSRLRVPVPQSRR